MAELLASCYPFNYQFNSAMLDAADSEDDAKGENGDDHKMRKDVCHHHYQPPLDRKGSFSPEFANSASIKTDVKTQDNYNRDPVVETPAVSTSNPDDQTDFANHPGNLDRCMPLLLTDKCNRFRPKKS